MMLPESEMYEILRTRNKLKNRDERREWYLSHQEHIKLMEDRGLVVLGYAWIWTRVVCTVSFII